MVAIRCATHSQLVAHALLLCSDRTVAASAAASRISASSRIVHSFHYPFLLRSLCTHSNMPPKRKRHGQSKVHSQPAPVAEPTLPQQYDDMNHYDDADDADGFEDVEGQELEQPRDDDEEHMDDDDDDDDEGIDYDGTGDVEQESAGAAPAKKKSKSASSDKFALPSTEELTNLKDTAELFKSNLFKLQIQELLSETVPATHKLNKLNTWLYDLKAILDSIPTQTVKIDSTLPIGYTLRSGNHFSKESQAGVFTYHPPSRIDLIGSYLLHTLTRPYTNVDIVLTIPKSMFGEKDFMDHRYHDKRAAYLSVIYTALKKHIGQEFTEMKVCGLRGEVTKPVLLLTGLCKKVETAAPVESTPGKKKKSSTPAAPTVTYEPYKGTLASFTARIFTTIDNDAFNIKKLAPTRRNIDRVVAEGDIANRQRDVAPSPYYNSLILEDMYFRAHLERLHSIISNQQNMIEAVELLKIWAHQRALTVPDWGALQITDTTSKKNKAAAAVSVYEQRTSVAQHHNTSINGFILTYLLCHLLSIGYVTKHMSCYQLFRMTLRYITESDWHSEGMIYAKNVSNIKKLYEVMLSTNPSAPKPAELHTLPQFTKTFDVTFLDEHGLNLTSRCSLTNYNNLKHEANLTLQSLESTSIVADSFESIFMKPVHFEKKYDVYLRLKLQQTWNSAAYLSNYPGYDALSATIAYLTSLLQRAYTDRVTLLYIKPATATATAADSIPSLDLGLILHPASSSRIIDMGPAPDQVEASAAFRSFWGDLSSLRRFKDGQIVDAVVWLFSDGDLKGKEMSPLAIIAAITKHITHKHMSVELANVHMVGNQLDSLLKLRTVSGAEYGSPVFGNPTIDPTLSASSLQVAFKQFSDMVKNLSDIPLSIVNIRPLHPAFRSAAVFPPQPVTLRQLKANDPSCVIEPIPVLMQFEHSNRWPDNSLAIARIKTAFYIQIAKSMNTKHDVPSVVG